MQHMEVWIVWKTEKAKSWMGTFRVQAVSQLEEIQICPAQ